MRFITSAIACLASAAVITAFPQPLVTAVTKTFENYETFTVTKADETIQTQYTTYIKPTHTVDVVKPTQSHVTEVIERYETVWVENHPESSLTTVTEVPTVYVKTMTVTKDCIPITVTPTVTASPVTLTVTKRAATFTSTVTVYYKDRAPKPTQASCENGAYQCADSGHSTRFTVCSNGKLDEFHCAAGTVCKTFEDSIVCDWPSVS
ncbi:hypothetical protein K7432_002840 [Basidiobolus ranarum]|uniref:Chitin-binding type-2 domain-containing protein n=1 Tax=Basidiobolus ranarum TaxID=34480 RepID=A0ABR2W759_9FUNG